MAIKKFLVLLRSKKTFPLDTEKNFNQYQDKMLEAFVGLVPSFTVLYTTGIWQIREQGENALLHLEGADKCPDLIVIEDNPDYIALIFEQIEKSGLISKVVVADNPDTVKWLLDHDIFSPKLITLDFELRESDIDFTIAEELYDRIKSKWASACVIGFTNNENQSPAKTLEDKIRMHGESVFDKGKFLGVLSDILRDRLRMHELQREYVKLKEENIHLADENEFLKKPLPEKSGKAYLRGTSEPMQRLYRELEIIQKQQSQRVVFISGATGTGKNEVARAIVEDWKMTKNCTVKRCGSIDKEGLFGVSHKGNPRQEVDFDGLLTKYRSGIVIFDGTEQLSKDIQERLVEVMDTGQFKREYGLEEESTNVKFIFLSTKDPDTLYSAGRLTEGFWSRISSRKIVLPELNKRKGDIEDL